MPSALRIRLASRNTRSAITNVTADAAASTNVAAGRAVGSGISSPRSRVRDRPLGRREMSRLRKQLDHEHARDDEAEADQGRKIEPLLIEEPARDRDEHDADRRPHDGGDADRKSTRLNSSHTDISRMP